MRVMTIVGGYQEQTTWWLSDSEIIEKPEPSVLNKIKCLPNTGHDYGVNSMLKKIVGPL